MVVQAEDRVAREAIEQAVGDHALCAAVLAGFFGRLEDQVHRAGEVAGARQLARGAQQHGGVAVMAAGVHFSGDGGWHRGTPVSSWIGSASMSARTLTRAPALAHGEGADDAVTADVAGDLIAPFGQSRRYQFRPFRPPRRRARDSRCSRRRMPVRKLPASARSRELAEAGVSGGHVVHVGLPLDRVGGCGGGTRGVAAAQVPVEAGHDRQPFAQHRRRQVLVRRMLRAAGIGVRHPDGRRPSMSVKISLGSEPPRLGRMAGFLPVVCGKRCRRPSAPRRRRDRCGWRGTSPRAWWRS